MRRVWFTRGVLLPLVAILAASFVFLGNGSNNVEASAFAPTLTAQTCSPGTGDVGGPACTPLNSPGVPATIRESADWGFSATTNGRAFPASSVYFTPNGWGIPDCSPTGACPYAYDEKTGTFLSVTTFGILNSQCQIAAGPPVVAFPDGMRNASTDPNDSIAPGPAFADLNADVNPANGIPDGMEHWNTLLGGLMAAGILPSTPPRERQVLRTVALGTPVWVDVVTYDPGLLGGAATAPLGSATTFILENANPLQPPTPGAITDTCGLLNQFSQSAFAAGGAVHRSNPASPGTKAFGLNSGSSRDADQGPSAPAEPTVYPFPPPSGGLDGDGLVNNIDTCPFQPNFGSPLSPGVNQPFSGDEEPGITTDGIDSACDPNPTAFDGTDADFDGYQNRGDNCPLVTNGPFSGPNNQGDVGEFSSGTPVDGGPASDGIGDVCDINPTVADGHFHTKLNLAPVCITGGPFADGDGDGWCDVEELAIGGSIAGTPESLQVPGSCSDAADNDLDLQTDLNDTGCQLPSHDLSIKKLNQVTTVVPCAGGTANFNLLINNGGPTADSGEISIYLDSQPSYVPPVGPNPAPGKTAGSVTSIAGATIETRPDGSLVQGPINIDGDADVEWLTKALVSVKHSPATTTVQFSVNFPAAPCTTGTDYMMTVDLCHGNDVAPLGVAPLNGNCAGSATSDGGQDRNSGNDITQKNIDAR